MSRTLENNSGDLLTYFTSFLIDATSTITEIKSMVYGIINIPSPSMSKMEISNDVFSMMSTCKRTFEDLKRIQTILKGHTKSKKLQQQNSLKFTSESRLKQRLGTSASTQQLSRVQSYNLLKLTRKNQSNELQEKQSAQSTQNQFFLRNNEIKIQDRIRQNLIEQELTSIDNEQYSESRIINEKKTPSEMIQELRKKKCKKIQEFDEGNQTCLNLIYKIRQELNLKKSSRTRIVS